MCGYDDNNEEFPWDYDRTWTNDDGTVFYGQDEGDGTTTWYNQDGEIDWVTSTPSDYEQDQNDLRSHSL